MRIKKQTTIETHLPINSSKKSNVTLCYETDNLTDLVHSIYVCLWSFWKAWAKSVTKVFLYNGLTRLCSQTEGIQLRMQGLHLLCYVCSLCGTNNLYHIWKLLYSVASFIFLVLFSATNLVLFDLLDENGALFEHVLCDIPVLRIS